MSTTRLYYQNPYQKLAETAITAEKKAEEGWWFSFAETVFYPEGGGQAADTGLINHEHVLDVQSEEREVWHLLPAKISNPVKMQLDWDKRYANMQQHTGQHILSACFKDRHNLDTVAVHLGSDITMIELKTETLDQKTLKDTENAANKIIGQGLPVKPLWVNLEELGDIKLRRSIKKAQDDIRLIEIGDIDRVGCGGIHVRSTSEVGLIKIVGLEKIRNHVRVQIRIGPSAYLYFEELHQVFQKISNRLTTSVAELPVRIETLLADQKAQARQLSRVNDLWMKTTAETLAEGPQAGCFLLNELNGAHLKTLSESWLNKHQRACLFVSRDQARMYFFIRLPDKSPLNLQEFLNKNRAEFSLRGGGSKEFASGQIDDLRMDQPRINLLFQKFAEFQKAGG